MMEVAFTLQRIYKATVELHTQYKSVMAYRARFCLVVQSLEKSTEQLKRVEEDKQANPVLVAAINTLAPLAEEACETMRKYSDKGWIRLFVDIGMGEGTSGGQDIEDLYKKVADAQIGVMQALAVQSYHDQQEIKRLLGEAANRDAQQQSMLRKIDKDLSDHIAKAADGVKMIAFCQNLSNTLPDSCVSDLASFRSVLAMLQARVVNHDVNRLLYGGAKNNEFGDIKVLKERALSVLDRTADVLVKLPRDVMRDEERARLDNITKTLQGRRQRIENLTLRACFVGPAKSGKSTVINAILGEKLAPSDAEPMTVLPTVLKHKKLKNPELHLPGLKHYDTALKALKARIAEVGQLIEGKRVRFSQGELELAEEIRKGSFTVEKSLSRKTVLAKLSDCSGVLAKLNHLCRLCARVNQALGLAGVQAIPNPILLLHQQSMFDNAPCWPQVHVQMFMLAHSEIDFNEEGADVFEIIDTPGRDELYLIKEIGPVITTIVEDAACCVCVCNATTAFTDSQRSIKNELDQSCQYAPATYILANKCDMLKTKDQETIRDGLARDFLRNPEQKDQVYAISAKWELMHSIFKTLEKKHGRVTILDELKGLPDVDESKATELQTELLEWADAAYGKANWETSVAGDVDWSSHDKANRNLNTKGKFAFFQQHLMEEVAPNAGRVIVHQFTKDMLENFDTFTGSLDFIIEAFGQGEEEYQHTKQQLTDLQSRVNSVLWPRINKAVDETLERFSQLIFQSDAAKSCIADMKRLIGEEADKLLDTRIDGLLTCVSEDDIQANKDYMEPAWKGKAVWRFFEAESARQFESRQQQRAQEVANEVLTGLSTKLQTMLKAEIERLGEMLITEIEKIRDPDEADNLRMDLGKMNWPSVVLRMQDERLAREKETYTEWWLFWLIPMKTKKGSVSCLVHDSSDFEDKALKQSLQAGCERATQQSLQTLMYQVEHHVGIMKDAVRREVSRKLEDREFQLDKLSRMRDQRDSSNLLKKFCKARLHLEGLRVDAKVVDDCAKPQNRLRWRFGQKGKSDTWEHKLEQSGGKGQDNSKKCCNVQ